MSDKPDGSVVFSENNLKVYGNNPAAAQIGGKSKTGYWEFPPYSWTLESFNRLAPGDLIVSPSIKQFTEGWGFPPDVKRIEALKKHPGYASLFPFQQEAAEFLVSSPHPGSLLGLSPGLGKTFTSIVAGESQASKILVVAPLILLRGWEQEVRRWGKYNPFVFHKEQPPNIGREGWAITNYDTAVTYVDKIKGKFDLLVIDESVLIKNRQTKRYKALLEIRKTITHCILLSGSPITKHADDLWAQFHMIDPKAFTSYWRFVQNYCHSIQTNWGVQVTGTRRDINFFHEFRDVMYIRNQKEVYSQLPEMIFETHEFPLTPEQQKIYSQIHKEFIAELNGKVELSVTSKIAQLTRLQQVTSNLCNLGDQFPDSSSKADAIIELLEAKALPTPVIIWTQWVPGARALLKRIQKTFPGLRSSLITGDTDIKIRDDIIKRFRDEKVDVLILSLGTGKFGLTLIEARSMVYLDKSWDGDAYIQSLARVHRIGLNHRPLVISLYTRSTTDTLVRQNLEGKMRSISQITNAELQILLAGLRGNK